MPSLEQAQAEPIVVNALRKDVERKQLEFLKSDKRQPVPLSSRFLKFSTKQFVFETASDEQVASLIARKVYWEAKLGSSSLHITNAADLLYTGRNAAQFIDAAKSLASDGLINLQGENASATQKLLSRSEEIEHDMRIALEKLQEKHAFERA